MDDLAFASLGMPQQPLGGGHPSGTLTSGYNSGHTSGHATPGGHVQVPELATILHKYFTIITEKAPTMAFSWLKVLTSAFTFKTLC